MVGDSKILTVSYGTFSCTLEGFDDPFSTMRSIAEYFRDLAAQDRFFGAEPPQPDAEMLHRIAERDASRRIEARMQDNGVVLRQMDEGESEPAKAAQRAPAPKRAAPAPAPAPAQAAPVDANGETVAAKLQRIRAAVARSQAEPLLNTAFAEDEHAEDLYQETSIETAFAGVEDEPAEDEPVTALYGSAGVEEPAAETELEAVDAPQPEPASAAQPEAEEEALDLSDLIGETADDEESTAEPEETAVEAEAEAEVEREEAEAEPEEAIAEAEEAPEEEAAAEEPVADVAEAEEPSHVEAAEEEPAEAAEEAAATIEAETEVEVEVEVEVAEAEAEEPVAAADEAAGTAEEEAAEEIAGEAEAEVAPEPAPRAAPRARVVKMTREEFEATFEADDVEEPAEEAAATSSLVDEIADSLGETGLSPEEEADLVSELAEVEREAAETEAPVADADLTSLSEGDEGEAPEEETVAEDAEDAQREAVKRDLKAAVDAQREDDKDGRSVTRLLEQTNSQMANDEGSRRRSAIAHLKAAVAAVRADGGRDNLTDDDEETTRSMDEYRGDLAKIVRPEPAAPAEPHKPRPQQPQSSRRPSRRRLPPLMLVSEQRIDRPEPTEDAALVRPRRITSEDQDLAGSTDGDERGSDVGDQLIGDKGEISEFRSFADQAGAESLEELLEASAAFAVLVKDEASNTRPQIMHRVVKYMDADDFNREDGLRAFGVLLREGKIQRVERGRFTISDKSEYAARRAS